MCHSTRRCHVAPQSVQELSDTLVQVWEERPKDPIHHVIGSIPQNNNLGITQNTEYHFELLPF